MDFSDKKTRKLTIWIIGLVTICSLIYLGLQNISSVLSGVAWFFKLISPFILGVGFAMVLDVPMRFFERHILAKTKKPSLMKLRGPLSFVVSLLVIIGILAGVIILVIPELIDAVKVIIQIVTDFVNKLMSMSEEELAEIPFAEVILNADWEKMLNSAEDWLKNQGGTLVNTAFNTVGSVVTSVVNIGIGLVIAIYILLSKDKLKSQAKRLLKAWLPAKYGDNIWYFAKIANDNFRNFVSGQTLEAMILGGLCMLGMLILRIPYAPMVGALVGVTALIPVIGGFIGAGVGAVMILTQDPLKALIFVIFLTVLQQLEGNLIYPKVMGTRVNLPALWILVAVTIGGSLAGPLGMFLSVPIASTAYVLIKEATAKREAKLSPKENKEVTETSSVENFEKSES